VRRPHRILVIHAQTPEAPRCCGGQLSPAGIAVSAVAPGLTDTPASRVVNTDQQFDAGVDRQALKRRLTPDDTAAAVAYLASDAAAAMTGQVLCADGGLIMR
jgi:NAD(P)-dependent dehydrogenase (short-subunit alcohol dehydrogenase family)